MERPWPDLDLAQAMRFMFTEEELSLLDGLPGDEEEPEAAEGASAHTQLSCGMPRKATTLEQPDIMNMEKEVSSSRANLS